MHNICIHNYSPLDQFLEESVIATILLVHLDPDIFAHSFRQIAHVLLDWMKSVGLKQCLRLPTDSQLDWIEVWALTSAFKHVQGL